ncbi:MAG: DoxX family protein [Bacteroidales bacterium]
MAQKASSAVQDIWLLILRVGAGGAMLTHGIPKFLQVVGGNFKFADPFGIGSTPSLLLAAGAEFFCSVLVILGIYTRWTSIPVAITMLTAIFVVHANDPFRNKELAVLYFLVFFTLSVFGGGNYSLGRLLGGRK